MNPRDLDCQFRRPASAAASRLLDFLVGCVRWSNVQKILSSRVENSWNDAGIHHELNLIVLVHI